MTTRDFERNFDADVVPHVEKETVTCASVKGWEEDGFAQWVADHREQVKSAVCSMSGYRDVVGCKAS